jgi:sterol desaturase/sphingolipid hydroxylase (fatty acid hydroxylase superfamily)
LQSVALQLASLALFSLVGWRWPRRPDGLFHADTLVNVVTGGGLAALRIALGGALAYVPAGGLVPLGGWPVAAQWCVGFAALDCARWGLHRLHHSVPALWQFHRVHHSSERLNATSGLRMHAVDFAQLTLLPILVFQGLFDAQGSPVWLIPACMLPGAVLDAFEHANVALPTRSRFWRAWDVVLNNPHFHAWHHTAEGRVCDGNYGNALTIWDRMFGTCVSRPGLPEHFGLASDRLTNSALGLQLLRPAADQSASGGG